MSLFSTLNGWKEGVSATWWWIVVGHTIHLLNHRPEQILVLCAHVLKYDALLISWFYYYLLQLFSRAADCTHKLPTQHVKNGSAEMRCATSERTRGKQTQANRIFTTLTPK